MTKSSPSSQAITGIELKACPFCGAIPNIEFSHEAGQWDVYEIECDCGVSVYGPCGHKGDDAKAATIRKWNKRPTPDLGEDERLVERAKASIEILANHPNGMSLEEWGLTITPVLSALDRITSLHAALTKAEAEARRFADFYPEGSDGRNTFVIFADKIAALGGIGDEVG